MKKKSGKITLQRETLKQLSAGQVSGADGLAATIAEVESGDLCKSCLCISEPESVCLCSGGGITVRA